MPASDLQLSFGGLTCGAGTPYRIRTITGLRDFEAVASDEAAASRWGTLVGADQVDAAKVSIEFVFANDSTVLADLQAAFLPAPQTSPASLGELAWKWPDEPEMFRQARCRRRARVLSPVSERTGGMVVMLVELQAPDPRAYSTAVQEDALAPFGDDSLGLDLTQSSGVNVGLDLDQSSGVNLGVDLSGTTGAGTVVVVNAGNTESWPVVTFTAPAGMVSWRLQNLTTGEVAEFRWPLGAGEQMVVDFASVATPKPGDAVLVAGAPRYSAWLHPRTPLALVEGPNEFRFDVLDGDGAAVAVVESRSAWL